MAGAPTVGERRGAALLALRRFAGAAPSIARHASERCELCDNALSETHEHLLTTGRTALHCVCAICAQAAPPQAGERVVSRVRRLPLELGTEQWYELGLPVGLALISLRRCADGGAELVAHYPSPAGLVEAPLCADVVERWAQHVPAALELGASDRLLLRRRSGRVCALVVSVDHAFALTGLLRRHWQGFDGGAAVQAAVADFLDDLDRRSLP